MQMGRKYLVVAICLQWSLVKQVSEARMDDMNYGDYVQVEDLEKDGRDLVEASCPASECWGCSA